MAQPWLVGGSNIPDFPVVRQIECLPIGSQFTSTPGLLECFMQLEEWGRMWVFKVIIPDCALPLLYCGKPHRCTFKGVRGNKCDDKLDYVQLTPGGEFYPIYT